MMPTEPKYKAIMAAVDFLTDAGFEEQVILTEGETSSHMWTYAHQKTYASLEEFLENSKKDYEEAVKNAHQGRPNCDWRETRFMLKKDLDDGDIDVFIRIVGNDDITCEEVPAKVYWTAQVPEGCVDNKFVQMVINKLEKLDAQVLL